MLLMFFLFLGGVQLHVRGEGVVFGNVNSIVGSMQQFVLLALFPLGRLFALLILASQLLLPFFERCA